MMLRLLRRPWAVFAVLATLTAVLLSREQSSTTSDDDLYNQVQGKNNTVLFLVNSNYGYSNVHLATAYALLERHPDVKIHFGSYERMRPRVQRVEAAGASVNPAAQPISFHLLPADEYTVALAARGVHSTIDNMIVPKGLAGNRILTKTLRWIFAPWLQEDHLAIYRATRELIDEIDPAVVVLDPVLRPATEAAKDANRLHAVISPMTLEYFITDQPWGQFFWKYPL